MLPEQHGDDLSDAKMLKAGARIVFTFLWQEDWEGKIFRWRLFDLARKTTSILFAVCDAAIHDERGDACVDE